MIIFQFKPISILQMCSAVAVLISGLLVIINNRKKLKNWAFFIATVTAFLWLTSSAILTGGLNINLILTIYKRLGFLGISLIGPSVYLFVVSMLEIYQKHRKEVIAFYSISAIFYILANIFPFFSIKYTRWGYYTRSGTFGSIFLIYFLLIMLYSFVLLFTGYKKETSSLKKKQILLFIIALIIAFTGSVDFAIDFGYNIYPFGFASILIFCIINSVAIIKYNFLILEPEMAYTTIFNSLASFVIGVDLEDRIRFTNEVTLNTLKYKKEDLIGKPIDLIFVRKDYYNIMKEKIVENKNIQDTKETYLVTSEKKQIPVMFTISPIKTESERSKILGFVIIAQDITKRIKAENKLVESEARLKKILETANEGFWLIDNQSVTLDVNPYMCKILGLRKEDIIGHKIYEFVDKKNKAIFENQIALRDRGKESAYEITLLNSKGSKIHCLFNATPLYDKGEKIGSFAMITDITKIKELENKLRKYSKELEKRVDERTKELAIINEQLKKANEIKSNFLANVSHELRTPLTSIRSFSEILLDYKNEDESIREEFLKIINEEAERLTRLINDVLDVSKIEAGKIEWSDDFYYIEEIVTEALNFILPLANKKSIPVKKEISQNLPPVFVDKDRIVQVFLNLLDNAVKFTDKGQVKIGAKLQDRSILCYVSDSGKGIPEAYQSKIFERFEQVNEDVLSGKKARGTGLGLSICKGIIEHYGGEMWLESQIGKGSTFFFTLPVRLRGKKTRPMMPKTPSPDRKKILIIDDDIDFISAVKFYLEKKGYKVYAAYDGEEGIKTCQIVKPDLIILDMLMPKKNGINTLKSLKKDRLIKNTPVIVLTVNAIENGRTKCLALGAKRYITKKENLDALLKEIKEVLENEKKE